MNEITIPQDSLYRKISLTKGKFAIVDDADYKDISSKKWFAKSIGYAARRERDSSGKQYEHRYIMNPPPGIQIDHINGDGLDNRRKNLRFCTQAENMRNRRPSANKSSKYKGVRWSKSEKKWGAKIVINYKIIHLGWFKEEAPAALAYNKAAMEHHGEFARLNQVYP